MTRSRALGGSRQLVSLAATQSPPSRTDPLTTSPSKLLFLPGASGNSEFWRPAAERLAHPAQQAHIGWPGFGSTPPDPSVTGMADLVARVLPEID